MKILVVSGGGNIDGGDAGEAGTGGGNSVDVACL